MRWPRPDVKDMKRTKEKISSWIWRREEKIENLIVFSPFMLPSFRSKFSRKINSLLLAKQIRMLCKKYGMEDCILVTTLPIVSDLVGRLNEARSIYYCVDEFSQWPGMMKDVMQKMERDLIGKVDLILAASDRLYHSKKDSQCPVYLLTHGVDVEHFMKADLIETEVPVDIAYIRKPIIGLSGSFVERTDYDIIKHIALTHSDWSIVLIGRILTRATHISKLKNVFFMGPRPYELLPSYLKAFDVCIIPYIVSDGSIFNSSPVKLKEYLASGKPVVSTPIPEVEKFAGIVEMANDKDEFVESIELVLRENSREKIEIRQRAVREDSWDAKAEEFSGHVERISRVKKINVMHLRSVNGTGGGPEKTILLSGERIDKSRFNAMIVYLKGADDKDFGVTQKAEKFDINYFEIAEKGKFDFSTVRKLKAMIKEHDIDIVHAHGYKSDFYGWVLSKLCDVKLVATTHGWIGNDLKERFYNWIDKKTIRRYDRVISVCEMMRGYLMSAGVYSPRIKTIYNAIDTNDFKNNGSGHDLRSELGIDKNTPVIGVVGRLSREKRIEVLFHMAEKIIKKVGDVKFLIVGDGPMRKSLQRTVNSLQLEDNVIFLGQRQDLKRIYKTMDLLVSISSTEGLPNNVLEALSMEVPVVATNVGGVGEIIRNRINGLLFEPEDSDGIAEGIVRLLSDRQMASCLSQEGRRSVCRDFSFSVRMRRMERVYLDVVER